jgi:hypothetical protein
VKSVLFTLFILGFLSACTSKPVTAPTSQVDWQLPPRADSKPSGKRQDVSESEIQVDQEALQRWLGLDRELEDLGYAERSFDTCEAGFGYSKSHNCQIKHMIVIHYRLQCRDSEGTVQQALTSADLRNIASENVRWTLPGQSGVSRTNGHGYGQIRGIFSSSQRNQRLKLGVGNDFLYMRANEITQVVTPQSWCQ